jgi:predicted P-loop ATPase/GTPase
VGTSSFDSGKTTFAGLLIDEIRQYTGSIEYFKPISAHNYWQRFAHTQYCIEKKRIYSADLASIKTKLNSLKDEYLLNPIHRLYVPTASEKPLVNLPSTLGLAGPDAVVALQRFSRPEGKEIRSIALVADQLLEEIQQFERENLENYLNSAFSQVEDGTDTVVIESFNDTAWVWEGLNTADLVLVIGPGQVFSYDPERFRRAAFLQKHPSMPIREVTFSGINDLLRPLTRDSWTPGGLETTEMLSDAFD